MQRLSLAQFIAAPNDDDVANLGAHAHTNCAGHHLSKQPRRAKCERLDTSSCRAHRMNRHPRGYSLIELSVVIAAIALLATIAVPSYQRIVRKTHRVSAMALLLDLHVRQEKYRADNAAYAATLTQIGAPTSGEVIDYYVLSIPTSTATSNMLRAVAGNNGNQSADTQNGVSCAQLEIDQSGARTPAACWR
jgi:type IV pilus assembly protein PilE